MSRDESAAAQDQDVETLRAILCCYEADGKTEGGTAGMLTLRQAQLGREALGRIEQRLSTGAALAAVVDECVKAGHITAVPS